MVVKAGGMSPGPGVRADPIVLLELRDYAIRAEDVLAAVEHPASGGVTAFFGYVRAEDGGRPSRIASQPRERPDLISPRIDRLLTHVDSDYASVVVAAKRARQINSYYHNLGEGTFDEFPPPMVETRSKNYLTIALEEVAAGKIKYHYR